MFKKLVRCFGIVFAFALAGCVAGGQFVNDLAVSRQSVGVYSGMPDQFQNMRVGLTVFNNNFAHIDSARWNMNGFAEKTVQAQLRGQGVPKVEILRTNRRLTETIQNSGVFKDKKPEIFAEVFRAAESRGLQKVALITQNLYSEGPADFNGPYGIWVAEALGLKRDPILYIKSDVSFYDVKTRKFEQSFALRPPVEFGSKPPKTTNVTFQRDISNYSANDLRTFERELKAQFKQAVQSQLRAAPGS